MKILAMPTVDVEAAHGNAPFDQLIEGSIGSDADWGVYRIARIFREYGVRGVFFVDVYEDLLWGERRFEELCCRLLDMNQDVQLHTHPGWRRDSRDSPRLQALKRERCVFPPNRSFMADLTLDEQVAFLAAGVDRFQRWLGRKPIAHRSGGYSVSLDTLRALARLSIPIDSSVNPSHRNTQVKTPPNVIQEINGILEFPVTIVKASPSPLLRRLRGTAFLRTDVDTLAAPAMRHYIRSARVHGITPFNLFLHSYSLIQASHDFRRFSPSKSKEACLRLTLQYMVDTPDVKLIDSHELFQLALSDPLQLTGKSAVPIVRCPRTLCGLTSRRVNAGMANILQKLKGCDSLDAVQQAHQP